MSPRAVYDNIDFYHYIDLSISDGNALQFYSVRFLSDKIGTHRAK